MPRSTQNPALHAFAFFLTLWTLFLIAAGGLVTSHGVGMAVPDWPTTYGYNMFFFPLRLWDGGIFLEHSHRLIASFAGIFTIILAVWLWVREERRWLRWTGVAAVFAVSVQGLMGGLRVVWIKDMIGVPHAITAQLFLLLLALITLWTSRRWEGLAQIRSAVPISRCLLRGLLFTSTLILIQLALGAAMRHQHAGLAVPDFPLAYGEIWPPTDAAFLERVNALRTDMREFKPITAGQVHLHMAHRLTACLVLTAVIWMVLWLRKTFGSGSRGARWAMGWLVLVLMQAGLGAWTVWSNKAADIATAHVVMGAACLVYSGLFTAVVWAKRPPKESTSLPGSCNLAATRL